MSGTNKKCQPSYNTLNLPRICQRIVNQLLGRQLPRRSLVHWLEIDLAILQCPLPLHCRNMSFTNVTEFNPSNHNF